jgi:hypothetical protein
MDRLKQFKFTPKKSKWHTTRVQRDIVKCSNGQTEKVQMDTVNSPNGYKKVKPLQSFIKYVFYVQMDSVYAE